MTSCNLILCSMLFGRRTSAR
uniref:Uncharacterized protein n=1 Tax=Rhizophora mucronata TaxID=61149 RepID=A0A2P2PGG3_RHIMU